MCGSFSRDMKKRIIFEGVGTALVTPFRDGGIDYTALGGLIEMQLRCGSDALIIGGTTGEAATLTDDERYRLFSFSRAKVNDRCRLVFGTGTNDTKAAVRHTMLASQIGCDGALVVTPYYNKGTEEGIVNHYLRIAEASGVPVLLYNVPTRTGVNLSFDALGRLAEHENIVGIKEAHDGFERQVKLAAFGDKLHRYAGADATFFPTLALGGLGVISVASNAYPERVRRIYTLFKEGKYAESLAAQVKLLPLIDALFIETNPSPIKFVMEKMGLCSGEVRLPLDRVRAENAEKILAAMEKI